MKTLALSALLLSACLSTDGLEEISSAQQLLLLPPGVTGAVRAYLGMENDGQHHYVIRDVNTNACFDRVVGGSAGLFSTTTIYLSEYSDSFAIPYAVNTTDIWCLDGGVWTGFFMQPIAATNIRDVSVYAQGGDDLVACNATFNVGGVICRGGTGNDHMDVRVNQRTVVLYGGPGSDTLRSVAPNADRLRMYGEEDNDCLQASITPTSSTDYDCGPGTDDRSSWLIGRDCELLVTSCP